MLIGFYLKFFNCIPSDELYVSAVCAMAILSVRPSDCSSHLRNVLKTTKHIKYHHFFNFSTARCF